MKNASLTPQRLNARQERFCEQIASGESQTDAWIQAGYKVSREVARRNAAEAVKNPRISARIAELRKPHTELALATKEYKRAILLEIINDPNVKPADRIRAVEVDARLAGHYAAERVELDGGQCLLASIEERAKRVGAVLSRVVPSMLP